EGRSGTARNDIVSAARLEIHRFGGRAMNIRRLGLALFCCCAFLVSSAARAEVMSWTVDGVARRALVFAPTAPTTAGGGKVPLVFAFHGHGGNMRGAARTMAFQEAWPEALVVYMQGLPTPSKIDPQGRLPGWQ